MLEFLSQFGDQWIQRFVVVVIDMMMIGGCPDNAGPEIGSRGLPSAECSGRRGESVRIDESGFRL